MEGKMKRMKTFYLIVVFAVSALPFSPAYAQTIPEEARRYMARGQAAVEMAKSPEEYDSAIKQFQKAAELAPAWPEPHYNLALLQEKKGKLKEAAASLREYLRLAPDAPDAAKLQEQIYKLEYKAEQLLTLPEIIDLLVNNRFRGVKGHFKLVNLKGVPFGWGSPCRLKARDGQLLACESDPVSLTPCMTGKNREDMDACLESLCQCQPVDFDGRKLEYECNYHHCPGYEKNNSCPWKFSYSRDIVSTSPLKIRTKELRSVLYGGSARVEEYEYLGEWVNQD
jgi:tetratricopeptide (TPR) repeat protein